MRVATTYICVKKRSDCTAEIHAWSALKENLTHGQRTQLNAELTTAPFSAIKRKSKRNDFSVVFIEVDFCFSPNKLDHGICHQKMTAKHGARSIGPHFIVAKHHMPIWTILFHHSNGRIDGSCLLWKRFPTYEDIWNAISTRFGWCLIPVVVLFNYLGSNCITNGSRSVLEQASQNWRVWRLTTISPVS